MLLLACKKDQVGNAGNQLVGKWELVSISGGIAGSTTNYPAGSGNTIMFDGASYKETRDNKLVSSGNYTTKRQMSILAGEEGDGLVYEGIEQRYFFSVNGKQLSIYHDAYDGFNNQYRKID